MRSPLQDPVKQRPIEQLKDVIDTFVTQGHPSDAGVEACSLLSRSIDPHSSVPLDYDKFDKALSSGTFFFRGRLRKKLAPHLVSRSAYQIEEKVFSEPDKLVSCNSSATIAILPISIETFHDNAFSKCPDLAHIICTLAQWEQLPYSLKIRIQGVTIINGPSRIPSDCFNRCRSLVYIGIPDTVDTIYSYAFSDCVSLRDPMLPDTITDINEYAFKNCGLSAFTFPPAVRFIDTGLFKGCSNLTKIELPTLATYINNHAFTGTAISSLFIPRTVTQFGYHVFSGCTRLAVIRTEDFSPLFTKIINRSVNILKQTIIVDNDYNPRYAPNARDWRKPDGFDALPAMHKALNIIPWLSCHTNVLNKYVASVVPKAATVSDCIGGRPSFWSSLSAVDRQRVKVLMLLSVRYSKESQHFLPAELWIAIATMVLKHDLPAIDVRINRNPENHCVSVSISQFNTIYRLFRDNQDQGESTASHNPDEPKALRQSS
ncbi:MAG: hypothetical protein COB66_03170 [Coxiella sp. (in: Bacteria)]|nr:MAG: hypothetical protein COB66_03170 [Coxiella sp. (in: g-proteobacteria)]